MRIILPVVFVLFAICGVFGVVLLNSVQNGEGRSEGDSALSFVFQMMSEDFVASAVPEKPIGALVTYLAEAPEGWTLEPYENVHGEEITNTVYQPSAVAVNGTNSLLSVFSSASRDTNGAAVTYRNGEEIVAVAISARSDRDMRSLRGSIMTAIGGNLSGVNGAFASGEFATLHGVKFTQGSAFSRVISTNAEVPINYRKFTAGMGGQMSITIMTNSSDATLATVMRGIDIPGLNETLMTPDLAVTAGTGLITRVRGELSDLPPPPTIPYKAFHRLRSGVEGLKEDDVRLLQAMANQKIAGWEDIYAEYGINHRLSSDVVEILGPEPELPAPLMVKYKAADMLQGSQWTQYERSILELLARGSVQTQGDAQRRLERGRLYAPPVMRLINELPVAQDVASADGTVEEAPEEVVIRRGVEVQQGTSQAGECVMELGTRRCIVEEPPE